MKEYFRVEYKIRSFWHILVTQKFPAGVIVHTIEEVIKERDNATRRDKKYGRTYQYRIVRITEEVVS